MARPSKPRKAQQRPRRSASGRGLLAGVVLAAVAALLGLRGRLAGVAERPSLVRTPCSRRDYKPAVPGCSPTGDACGRLVLDGFASAEELAGLRAIAARGMALGGGDGGPTILDLQSGALSWRDKFIDVWAAFNASGTPPFTTRDVAVYADVVRRIRSLAESTFGVSGLHLTAPTFFSRHSGDRPPKTEHDEYWHVHVDTLQYGSFTYTALLYLADGDVDFSGGRLAFVDERWERPLERVVPRPGKLVLFSSGHEHPHHVERVESGERLALTVAFTCDPEAALHDFLSRAVPEPEAEGGGGRGGEEG